MPGLHAPVSARPGAVDPPVSPGGLLLPDLPGALCKGQDPAPWFPRPGGSPDKGKAICRACPARRQLPGLGHRGR